MNRCIFFAAMLIVSVLPAAGQTLEDLMNAFDEFEQRTDEEFEVFRRRTQKEFGEFLKQSWQEFQLIRGEELPVTPKPVAPQVAEPETFDRMIRLPGGQVLPAPAIQENTPLPKPSTNNPATNYDELRLSFFGSNLTLPFDRKFVIKLRSTRETDVGDYWIRLADADFLLLVYVCRLIMDALGLNDWGYYQLVEKVAKQLYPAGTENEQTIFRAFILDETGYDVRIARNTATGKLVLMSVYESVLYSTPFLNISGKKYYIPGAANQSGNISSYPSYAKDDKRRIDLKISQPLRLKSETGIFGIAADVIGTPLRITYNRNAIDFYKTVPLTDMNVYFNSCGSVDIGQSLEATLKPVLEKMKEADAAGLLLQLMHHAFAYKTDMEQFGYERPFFFEELFAYPYSDCEDRSVLFAYLVRQLLGLQVVGLKYPGHMATAVRFTGGVNGRYVSFEGGDYIVCDPTYINAPIGQCMEQYRAVSPGLITMDYSR